MRGSALATAALAAAALAGCGGGGGASTAAGPVAKQVRTTRVEVVKGLGAGGGFDPGTLYRRLAPGVVTVVSLFGSSSAPAGGSSGGQGSGFEIDGDGYIATNAHVVTDGKPPRRARSVFVELSDGNRVNAAIVGTDPDADVALLKIDPSGLRLTPLELGRSQAVRVGEPVAAIGSPFGERQSLSVGVVSALDRSIDSLTSFQIGNAIQTDAAINPGNSGGPLLDARGRVVGINSQIKSASGGGEGVGFAVPVDTARRSLRELRRNGKVSYGFLGVTSQQLYPQLARRLGLAVRAGALVVKVQGDSPASRAGIEAGGDTISFQGQSGIPSDGDVIVAVDGRRLDRTEDLADVISRRNAGDTVRLEVLRKGKRRTVKVKLGSRPG